MGSGRPHSSKGGGTPGHSAASVGEQQEGQDGQQLAVCFIGSFVRSSAHVGRAAGRAGGIGGTWGWSRAHGWSTTSPWCPHDVPMLSPRPHDVPTSPAGQFGAHHASYSVRREEQRGEMGPHPRQGGLWVPIPNPPTPTIPSHSLFPLSAVGLPRPGCPPGSAGGSPPRQPNPPALLRQLCRSPSRLWGEMGV